VANAGGVVYRRCVYLETQTAGVKLCKYAWPAFVFLFGARPHDLAFFSIFWRLSCGFWFGWWRGRMQVLVQLEIFAPSRFCETSDSALKSR